MGTWRPVWFHFPDSFLQNPLSPQDQNSVNILSLHSQKNTSHFERCLLLVEQEVLRMGTLVEEAFRLSHQSLIHRNLDTPAQLKSLDRRIDQYYRKIENECVKLMNLKSPVSRDLRQLSAFMQLVRDLERIADYAQDLSEIAVKLFPYPPHEYLGEVEEMSLHAQLMLATSLVALADLDSSAGPRVKKMDDKIDDAYDGIYAKLAHQTNVQGSVEPMLLMVLIIRHLERMADHATNVAQRVSYIVTGCRD